MKSPWLSHPPADISEDTPAGAAGTSAPSPAKIVAHGVVQRFQQIDAVLAPIIGHGGVVAIYERTRHLSARSYPWLAGPDDGFGSGMDLEELKVLIGLQSNEEAAAGASCLVESIHDLLVSLIGEALTTQLLGAAPPPPPHLGTAPDQTT